jgi:hypothetical protein
MVRALVMLSMLLLSCPAYAQSQACGQRAGAIDYGLTIGAVIVPQRHRYVGGDPNWDVRMGRFLGREARVTRLSGVDEQGCPGVRIDVDGGRYFWRVRDIDAGSHRAIARSDRGCGGEYGAVRVGARVVLGRHRPFAGEDNWSAAMRPFVGRTARIVALVGADEQGCAGAHIDLDGGEWFWRVRDMRVLGEGEEVVAYAVGMAADHGRSLDGSAEAPPALDGRVPQTCGLTDATAQYGPVRVGTEVVIGRHREVDGETNWVALMDPYVGRRARVTQLVGVDDQGCPLIAVDIDNGDWYWRLRDVQLPER